MIENITTYRNLNGNNKSILSFCVPCYVSSSSQFISENDFFGINKKYLEFQNGTDGSGIYTLQPIDTIIFQCLIAPVHHTGSGGFVSPSTWTLELYEGGSSLLVKFKQTGDAPIIQSYTLQDIQVNKLFQFKIDGTGATSINPYGMFWGSFILGE